MDSNTIWAAKRGALAGGLVGTISGIGALALGGIVLAPVAILGAAVVGVATGSYVYFDSFKNHF